MSMDRIARIHGLNQSGVYSAARVDYSGGLRDISFEHFAVHDDGLMIATDVTTEAGSTSPYIYAVTVPQGKASHSQFSVNGNVPYILRLYEAETTDVTTGSLVAHARYNRASTIADTEDAWTLGGVSVADPGTLLFEEFSGGSTSKGNQKPTGEGTKPAEEWNFFYGKTYLLYIEPRQDGGTFSFKNDYYDVDIS